MGYIISKPRDLPRVVPAKCAACGHQPWQCPTCDDFQCNCIAPWLVDLNRKKGVPARMIRVHYDRDGKAYGPRFIDGYVPATDLADDDLESIISEEFAT